MKRIVGIVLCLAVVVAAGFYLLLRGKTEANSYARFLPPDAVLTVNLSHGNTLIDGFAASPLGKLLAKDTIHAIVQEMGGAPQETAEYDRVYNSVTAVVDDPAFRAVFGEDATLAMLSPDRKILAEKPEEALRDSLILVARSSMAGPLDMLSRLLKNAQFSRETVDGLNLVKITTNDGKIFYGYTEGKMVFLACAPATIKTCVSAGKGEAALNKAPAFQEAATFWKPFPEETTYSRMYINVPIMAELLKTAATPEFKEVGEMLAGVGATYSIGYETSHGMESRGHSGLAYDRLHPVMKGMIDASGKGNQTLHLLKENSLAYNWAASFQTERIIQALRADGEKEYQEIDQSARAVLGVSLEELGRAFGPQYGAVLDDIVRTPLFPWPKMTFFVELRDRAVAEKALNGVRGLITQEGIAGEEQEQVADQTVYSWPVLPGETQPATVLTGNMFYLSTSKPALKAILEAKDAPDALTAPVAAQLGSELSARMKAANFSSFVLYPARMSRQTGETLEWVGALLAASKQIGMERLKRELVQLMQSTELVVGTTEANRERIEWAMTAVKAKQPATAAGK
ncbi:MAG: hypothetical protein LBD10_02190 [Desulfobulbus sp.]|jgi:hypothetical protein|uniref:hypothetical protein n=1 Tax=Desulfobulbus sp. TaxID=895 RepID=UPI002843AAC6|nr:hypothetical protein [Desulfobulbus sp.]MDR2549006.1 hypothetical protein [Desulfobulbus sp.]